MATRRHDTTPVGELSDRALRDRLKRANQTLDQIERSDPSEAVRSGKADQLLAQGEQALATVREVEEEIGLRAHRSLPERLRLNRALRDGKRQPHPAARWLDEARRYSAPEIQGETLVASNLSEDDAAALETLVKRRRKIASDEHAEPLTDDEKREWERILGTAAGDPESFERKRPGRSGECEARRSLAAFSLAFA